MVRIVFQNLSRPNRFQDVVKTDFLMSVLGDSDSFFSSQQLNSGQNWVKLAAIQRFTCLIAMTVVYNPRLSLYLYFQEKQSSSADLLFKSAAFPAPDD